MQHCYLGIAKNDITLIEKAIELFECAGNRFYCKFPKKMVVEFNKNGIIYEGGAIWGRVLKMRIYNGNVIFTHK
ncbi:hypothetical protein BC30102_p523 (plasmid) [Bacillus cereus]|nr:hypothetical protein BC30102_p523 [Bacillus cereus]